MRDPAGADRRPCRDKVTVRFDGQAARRPSFRSTAPAATWACDFAAIPMGHEFTSLVLALLQAGGHPPKVEADVIEQIRSWRSKVTATSSSRPGCRLTCHNCPDVVQALNLMAVLNPRIRHVAIDGGLFQDEVEQRQIMAVPGGLPQRPAFRLRPHGTGARSWPRSTPAPRRATPPSCRRQGALRRADRRRRPGRRRGRGLRRAQGHPHRRGGRALRRPDAGHAGHRELHLGAAHRRAEVRRRAGGAGARQRGRHHERPARVRHRAGREPGGDDHACTLDNGAALQSRSGDPGDRRALAQRQRARRSRVPQQGRGLLPALRRPAVQGQGRGRDRRRQLRRRGGDRPRRRGAARDAGRVRARAEGRRGAGAASCRACPT